MSPVSLLSSFLCSKLYKDITILFLFLFGLGVEGGDDLFFFPLQNDGFLLLHFWHEVLYLYSFVAKNTNKNIVSLNTS